MPEMVQVGVYIRNHSENEGWLRKYRVRMPFSIGNKGETKSDSGRSKVDL